MKKTPVLSFTSLPSRFPITGTAVVYLLLDKFHASGWVQGAAWTVVGALWIGVFVSVFTEQKVELKDLMKDEGGRK